MDLQRSAPLKSTLAELLQSRAEDKKKGGKSWYSKETNSSKEERPLPPVVETKKEDNMSAAVLEVNETELDQAVNGNVRHDVVLPSDDELDVVTGNIRNIEEVEMEVEQIVEEMPMVEEVKPQLKDEITNKFEFELIDKSLRRIPTEEVVQKILAEVDGNGNLVPSLNPDFSKENYPLQPHTARLIKKFLLADKFRFRTPKWEAFFAIKHDKTNPRLEVTVIKHLK